MIRPLILFLDLDGVFKTARSALASMRYDPLISKLVNDLCRLPETRVVISATCRKSFDTAEECGAYWRDLGMPDLKLHEYWRTTTDTDVRTVEIQDWLERYHYLEPNVQYLFIDDEFPSYEEGMPGWVHDIVRQNWLLIGGHNNGATYNELRVLRGIFDERQAAYQEASAEETLRERAGAITRTQTAQHNRRTQSPEANGEANASGNVVDYDADAKAGFDQYEGLRMALAIHGLQDAIDGNITVRQHVAACNDEGCFICDALLNSAVLAIQRVESHKIPQRTDDATAHAQAEEAKRDYDGS